MIIVKGCGFFFKVFNLILSEVNYVIIYVLLVSLLGK